MQVSGPLTRHACGGSAYDAPDPSRELKRWGETRDLQYVPCRSHREPMMPALSLRANTLGDQQVVGDNTAPTACSRVWQHRRFLRSIGTSSISSIGRY